MSWQIAFALSIVIGIARVLYQRRYAIRSKVPATLPPAASYLFGVLPVGLVAGLFIFPHNIEWTWSMFWLMLVLSISMALANWLGFITARKLAIAPQQVIGMITNITVVVLGWTLLGEGLTLSQFVGGGILLVAAAIAIWAPSKTQAGDFEHLKPSVIFIAIAAAILLAIGLVTEKALLAHTEIGGIFLISWTAQALGMVLLASKDISRQSLRAFKGKELYAATLLGVINGFQGALYIYTIFHADNISLVTLIGTISLPLTVLAAYIFLHEREHHLLMWLSVGISTIGLLTLALL